ncbi:hypothetical protein ACT7CZ_18510, partial [Bacillus cereus]
FSRFSVVKRFRVFRAPLQSVSLWFSAFIIETLSRFSCAAMLFVTNLYDFLLIDFGQKLV